MSLSGPKSASYGRPRELPQHGRTLTLLDMCLRTSGRVEVRRPCEFDLSRYLSYPESKRENEKEWPEVSQLILEVTSSCGIVNDKKGLDTFIVVLKLSVKTVNHVLEIAHRSIGAARQ